MKIEVLKGIPVMKVFLLLVMTFGLLACTTPARIALPDSDTLEATVLEPPSMAAMSTACAS